jgi:hypothetical protein
MVLSVARGTVVHNNILNFFFLSIVLANSVYLKGHITTHIFHSPTLNSVPVATTHQIDSMKLGG